MNSDNKQKKHILFWVSQLHEFDGTSIDLLLQAQGLRDRGYQVSIYSRKSSVPNVPGLVTRDEALSLASSPSTTVVCHFCGFDRELALYRRKILGDFILRYQNITPAKWFLPYSFKSALHSFIGRIQVLLLIKFSTVACLASASSFSNQDLLKRVKSHKVLKSRVIPILGLYSKFDSILRPSEPSTSKAMCFFVGRIVPSKGLGHLIDMLITWKKDFAAQTKTSLEITIAGQTGDAFSAYKKLLVQQAQDAGVSENLKFIERPSLEELKHLFSSSNFYVCPSEHEGFCVPIIEAQHAGLPIIALDRSAVSETMGLGGVLITGDTDIGRKFCEAVSKLIHDPQYRQHITTAAFENTRRFETSKTLDALEAIFSRA